MAWRLAPHAFATAHRQDLVLLDVRTNAYLVVADAAAEVTLTPAAGRISFRRRGLSAELLKAGLLRPLAGPEPPPRLTLPHATGEVVGEGPLAPTFSEISDLAQSAIAMIWLYWLAPFPKLVTAAAQTTAHRSDQALRPGEALGRRAQIFSQLLPWVPFQGQCLFRAALLRHYLRRSGHQTRWVFGVRTWPFGAHCWLQIGETVLGDRAERVARYSPILVI